MAFRYKSHKMQFERWIQWMHLNNHDQKNIQNEEPWRTMIHIYTYKELSERCSIIGLDLKPDKCVDTTCFISCGAPTKSRRGTLERFIDDTHSCRNK